MNYEEALSSAIVRQGIKLKVSEIPFNIFLKNTNDILTLCFLEEETEDYLSIVETTDYGVEEVRIIPKENIEYVSIFYDFEESKEEPVDRMII
jgi:hypothetical protein